MEDVDGSGSKDGTTVRSEKRRDVDKRMGEVRVRKKIT